MAVGKVNEIFGSDALKTDSLDPFKSHLDFEKFRQLIEKYWGSRISFVRMEPTPTSWAASFYVARMALPCRVYTLAHMEYVADRIGWLLEKRDLVKGLRFLEEPPVLRFFTGRLQALDDWGTKLDMAFKKDFRLEAESRSNAKGFWKVNPLPRSTSYRPGILDSRTNDLWPMLPSPAWAVGKAKSSLHANDAINTSVPYSGTRPAD